MIFKFINFSLAIKLSFLCALLILPGAISAQYQGNPVTLERLETSLRAKQVSTGEIVEIIKKKGVNFQLVGDTEQKLVAAGARPQVLEAIRQHYRQDAVANVRNSGSNDSPASSSSAVKNSFTGAPLTKDAVIALLQNGVAEAQVQKNITGRGVNFQMNPDIARELKTAGGSDALIGTIFSAYVPSASSNAGSTTGTTTNAVNNAEKNSADAYEELLSRSISSFNSRNGYDSAQVSQSIQFLKQAIALDANDPRAYQSLGFQKLYGVRGNNFTEVEGYFNKAIALGGYAIVRVYHDHNGLFTDVCEGSLYISKSAVRFESDNNDHTFETNKENIQQVKVNNPFKQMLQEKKGSYKIVLKSEEKNGIKYSFAPLTESLEESKVVVRLVGKN